MGMVVTGKRSQRVKVFSYLILVIGAIILLAPIFWMVLTSLKPSRPLVMSPIERIGWDIIFFQPSTKYYEEVIGLAPSKYYGGDKFLNSIIIAGGGATASLFLGLLAAYGFSRYRFKGDASLAFFILSFRFLPVIAFVLPLFILFEKVWGIADTHPGVILAYAAFDIPFTTWVIRSFIHDIPRDLDDAMLVDGGTRWSVIRRVILPLAKPGIAVAMILAFTFAWNDFAVAYVLTRKSTTTVPVFLTGLRLSQGVLWEHLFAGATLQFIPLVAMVTLLEKHIVRGLTFGAVK